MPLLWKISRAALAVAAIALCSCATKGTRTAQADNIFVAAQSGNARAISSAISADADVNAVDESGRTALIIAAQNGMESAVLELISRGADVNAQSYSNGVTALMVAAQNGHTSVVKALINADADIEALSYAQRIDSDESDALNDAVNTHMTFCITL